MIGVPQHQQANECYCILAFFFFTPGPVKKTLILSRFQRKYISKMRLFYLSVRLTLSSASLLFFVQIVQVLLRDSVTHGIAAIIFCQQQAICKFFACYSFLMFSISIVVFSMLCRTSFTYTMPIISPMFLFHTISLNHLEKSGSLFRC